MHATDISRQLVIRVADPDDQATLSRLAALDSRRMPEGHVLIAEVDGEAWAAIAIADGHAVADPFLPTRPVVDVLRVRAEALRRPARPHARRAWARRFALGV